MFSYCTFSAFEDGPFWLVRPQGSVLDHWTIEASLFTAAAETSSFLTLKCHILLALTLHLEYRN
jgi:hypothetical protein